MMPALAGPDGLVNITRQNGSETSGFDRGDACLRPAAAIRRWQQRGSTRCMHRSSHRRTTGEPMARKMRIISSR